MINALLAAEAPSSPHDFYFVHAYIMIHPALNVIMLCSTNGTFLNGIKITSKTRCNPGDKIMFGAGPVFVLKRNILAHA